MPRLRSQVHFDSRELEQAVEAKVGGVTEQLAQRVLDAYVEGWPVASGDSLEAMSATIRTRGHATDLILENRLDYAVWVERRHWPINGPEFRRIIRAIVHDLASQRTFPDARSKRRFYSNAIHTGRRRGGRGRGPSARTRRIRAGRDFRRAVRVGHRGFGRDVGRGIRQGQRVGRRAIRPG